jgi:PAS domain-containing protein
LPITNTFETLKPGTMMHLIRSLFKRSGQGKTDSTDKYKQVLEQAPGAVYIINKQMRFEYINPFFTLLSGYSKEELIGKSITETLYRGKFLNRV